MVTIYTTQVPKICLSEKAEYDKKKNCYYAVITRTFSTEKELITFLAMQQKEVLNWDGNPIPGAYKNPYMDHQAFTGITQEILEGVYPYILFWLDVPESPILDVRKYKEDVLKKYRLLQQEENGMYKAWYGLSAHKSYKKQGQKTHRIYRGRTDCRYIRRTKEAYWLLFDEEEYRTFSKPKDRAFKSVWPDEDFIHGRHGSGWKDNPGNRCRHQWEPKAARSFAKTKRKKDTAIYSGSVMQRYYKERGFDEYRYSYV